MENKEDMVEHNEEVFELRRQYNNRGLYLVWVHFPQCPYPDKVMLYKTAVGEYTKQFNPHFKRGDSTSPIARFEPTEFGWSMGIRLLNLIKDDDKFGNHLK
jgi:hypothetical protein